MLQKSVNYIGSKYTLLPFLENVYRKISDGSEKVFCDLFAGTGAVGRHFKRLGLQIIANDLQYYAYSLNKAYIEINHQPAFSKLLQSMKCSDTTDNPVQIILDHLNNIEGVEGFISANYGPAGNRLYYTAQNAMKADAIRQSLNKWQNKRLIDEKEFFYVLAALIEAIDRVANTASVYGAYLKSYKASALKPLILKPIEVTNHVEGSRAFNSDANELIKNIECDVLYLDPPYNRREYGANYHVLETIARYDSPPLAGVSGLREYARSDYCKVGKVSQAFEDLILCAKAKHILVSYNDEGLMSMDDVQRILSLRGTPQVFETSYNRFKADSGREYKRDKTVEYVHYVKADF